MNIIAVDDEKSELDNLMKMIAAAAPEAEINGFGSGFDAFEYCKRESVRIDVAFLDIRMQDMDGIQLCKRLTELNPVTNIIFVTAHEEYALEAISLRCSGYVIKPATAKMITQELDHLRYPVPEDNAKKLYAKAFGRFEAFVDGRPLKFRYQKTKELLAFLVDRMGESASNDEIICALWEDDSPENSHISYLKNIRRDLEKTLDECGCRQCLSRTRGEMSIIVKAIDCDYYDYLANEDVEGAGKLFKGEYMSQYAWGEYTLASLLSRQGIWD